MRFFYRLDEFLTKKSQVNFKQLAWKQTTMMKTLGRAKLIQKNDLAKNYYSSHKVKSDFSVKVIFKSCLLTRFICEVGWWAQGGPNK